MKSDKNISTKNSNRQQLINENIRKISQEREDERSRHLLALKVAKENNQKVVFNCILEN